MGTKGFWGNNEHFDVIAGRGGTPALRFVQAVVLICGTSWRPSPTQEFYLSGFTVGGCGHVPILVR